MSVAPATARESLASTGCLVVFLLPFAATGVITGVLAVRGAIAGDLGQAAFLSVFALVFGGVGIGGIAGAFAGRRKAAETEALRAGRPEEPWLWRDDWAAGRIEDSARGTMRTAWIFAGLWNLVSLPAGWLGVREAVEKGNAEGLLGLLFPVVGIGLLVWAVKATLRYRRFGVSMLELRATPAVVGHGLMGVVRTTSPMTVPEGFRVVLSCLRLVTRGSGKNRRTSEHIHWQEERRVAGQPSRGPGGMTTTIPVAFGIPGDASPCDDSDRNDRVVWRLEVSASVPGVDYASTFEVPVFRTAQSAEPRTPNEEIELRDPSAPAEYRQPATSRIQVTTNRRGTEIFFPAARTPDIAVGLTFFLALWTGALWLLIRPGAPLVFPIVFGLFDLLLLLGVLHLWLGVTRVTVEEGRVTVGKGLLFPRRERSFPVAEIADVVLKVGMQAGSKPYYDLKLVRTNGKDMTAGSGIEDKREAEWLASVVKEAMGSQVSGRAT